MTRTLPSSSSPSAHSPHPLHLDLLMLKCHLPLPPSSPPNSNMSSSRPSSPPPPRTPSLLFGIFPITPDWPHSRPLTGTRERSKVRRGHEDTIVRLQKSRRDLYSFFLLYSFSFKEIVFFSASVVFVRSFRKYVFPGLQHV